MDEFKIIVENSAPSQSKPAKSVTWSCDILNDPTKDLSVVDLGCGRLRNLQILSTYFSNIILVDTIMQCERLIHARCDFKGNTLIDCESFENGSDEYDIIFLICVLHIIPTVSDRENLLKLAYSKLKPGGFLVVDVPQGEQYYKSKMIPENRINDGYLLGKGFKRTFYKNYHAKELDDFITKDDKFEMYIKKYFDKHLTRIFQKRDINAITK